METFAARPLDHVLSSPYVRCMETVVPLAATRHLAVEPEPALAEGAALDDVLALVRKHADRDTLACSHGDVIPMLLDHFARTGADVDPDAQWPKGSTWVVDVDPCGEVRRARYLPPPEP